MPFEMVSGVGQGMAPLDAGGDHQRGRGIPLQPVGTLLHSCVEEVREPVELSFGVVSCVVPGIDVLDGGPRG